ncbi:MAG: molybdopterin-dependent oxidoreductase [Spirochaetales bacterium]|jgi:anaerobic dimethyl sulfoxide reductase subunit A|nr:molybdopterin-dependent oxidoreductase [Spirochaetales bacterium]
MQKQILASWEQCSSFALFFDNFSAWLNEHGPAEEDLRQSLFREYEELFKGVSGEINIPLWASGCEDPEDDGLLNGRTLGVIKTYRLWGLEPQGMDGNPPDFIGEQFRFLAFLHGWALGALEKGEPAEIYGTAVKNWIAGPLGPTVKAAAQGIRRFGRSPVFLNLADKLEAFLLAADALFGGAPWGGVLPAKERAPAVPGPGLYGYPAYRDGPRSPLPVGPERAVNTAGRNNCGGKCAVRVKVQEGCLTGLTAGCGLAGEPIMRACGRGLAYRETFLNSRRLRYPMLRVGNRGEGRFRRVSWDEAADITAAEWLRIRRRFGPAARYVNYSTGVSAVLRPDDMVKRLLNLDGGRLGSYNSYSSACDHFTLPYVYGDGFNGNTIEDILNTKLLILWGHNPRETIFGSERNHYLTQVRKRGIPIRVIDPRQSDTLRSLGAQWIGIRPSTDAALGDAMAYVIWSEGRQDQAFMDAYCQGFDEAHMPPGFPPQESYRAYLFGEKDGVPKTPGWGAAITGLPPETILRLAREYASAKPACLLPGLGPQRTGNGEQTVRTLAMLTCLTGNVGKPGGGAGGAGGPRGFPYQGYPLSPNPCPAQIPSFLWTKAVEQGRAMTPQDDGLTGVERLDTDIKMIFNLAGNTLINQHSDINKTIRILGDPEKCEFIVCSDLFMTPSARFADLLLPGSSFFEDDNITSPWDFGNYWLFNNKALDSPFECRFEYSFIEALARRLGLWEAWSEGHENPGQWLESLYGGFRRINNSLPEYPAFKEAGGWHGESKPFIAYEKEIRDPARHPFKTPSGKIEIFSPRLYRLNRPGEVPAIPGYVPCAEGPQDPLREKYPLQLIGWHPGERTHSIPSRRFDRARRQRLWIHPQDAAPRGLQDGDIAEVFNDRGRLRLPLLITPRIIPGVVAMPQGAWYAPDSQGTDTGGSFNVLSSQRPTPLARGNPQHTNLVEVKKAEVLANV